MSKTLRNISSKKKNYNKRVKLEQARNKSAKREMMNYSF